MVGCTRWSRTGWDARGLAPALVCVGSGTQPSVQGAAPWLSAAAAEQSAEVAEQVAEAPTEPALAAN